MAHRSGGLGTVYLGFPDESFPIDHPRQWLGPYARCCRLRPVFGRVADATVVMSSPLTDFVVAAVPGLDGVQRYADPLGVLNLAVMGDDDELPWHFDQTDFVVSLVAGRGEAVVTSMSRPGSGRGRRTPLTPSRACSPWPRLGGDLADDTGTLLIFAGRIHSTV